MKYNECENMDLIKMMDELVEEIGVSYSSNANENHFGSLDIHTLIEIKKLVEMRQLNENLIRMNETLKYLRR